MKQHPIIYRRARALGFFLSLVLAFEITRGTRVFADSNREYDQIIQELAIEYDVDAALVKAVIRAESGFDPDAVSPKGARGLMQLMPRIARKHGVADPHDPSQNIRAGVRMLRDLLDRFDDNPRLAIAAYNAGGGAVERFRGLPPYRETRDYVAKVLRFRARYRTEEREAEDASFEERAAEQVAKNTETRVRRVKEEWPRGAETIWYGAPQASDGTFQAAFHSPVQNPAAPPAPQAP